MRRACFGRVWGLMILSACGAVRAEESDRMQPVPVTDELRARCVETLRTGFQSEEFWPSMHAAEGLTLTSFGAEVRSALAQRVAGEQDDQKKCGLARELVRAGDRSQIHWMLEILAKTDPYGHNHAAESLYKVAEAGDGRLLRQALAQQRDPRLQMMAAAALGRCGDNAAIDFVRTRIESDDVELRRVAAWILGLLGDQDDIEPLREQSLSETDPLIRAYFINALANLGDAAGRAEQRRNMDSPDAMVRTYSAEFAGYARNVEARPRLIELLDDENVDVRIRAAQSILALGLPPAALKLPRAVVPPEFSVDVYPATDEHPRYSEGSIITLRDDSLLYATTEFTGGRADHSSAQIIARKSTDGGRTWSAPAVLQENIGAHNCMSATLRRLRYGDENSPLAMFYLVKNSPTDLKIHLRLSTDEGASFGEPIIVTGEPGYHVMNNDRVTVLRGGRLICPVASTADVTGGGHFVSRCWFSDDAGQTWTRGVDALDAPRRGAMEPETIERENGEVTMITRTQLGHIGTGRSTDGGDHWTPGEPWSVTSPESPATVRRIPATGDWLLIWNNTYEAGAGHGGQRTPLSAAISTDEGQTWGRVRELDRRPGETYAYTSVLFHKDRVLLSYYVGDEATKRWSSRFRSIPTSALYEAAP